MKINKAYKFRLEPHDRHTQAKKDEAKYLNSKVEDVLFPYRGCTTEQVTKAKAEK